MNSEAEASGQGSGGHGRRSTMRAFPSTRPRINARWAGAASYPANPASSSLISQATGVSDNAPRSRVAACAGMLQWLNNLLSSIGQLVGHALRSACRQVAKTGKLGRQTAD